MPVIMRNRYLVFDYLLEGEVICGTVTLDQIDRIEDGHLYSKKGRIYQLIDERGIQRVLQEWRDSGCLP